MRKSDSKHYKVKTRKVIFSKGPVHLVDCDVRMKNGKILSRQVLEHPGSVVIIPKAARDQYFLVRQFRFAVRDWLWEFPAGGIDEGESLEDGAMRELMEEIGFRPRQLTKLFDFFPTPGISGERMHLYLAEDLVPQYAQGDEDEEIEVRKFSSREIEAMIRRRKIIDAKTIAGFLYLQYLHKKSKKN
ncbi:MAG: NUDIX hydrolase [Candidatus Omnitrophica bacterium]|nr:NUDIX hydrolase [Candidatus Omnitrophota bacterium]